MPTERRRAGVLLHPTSLPAGDIGDGAHRFVDWLADARQHIWQLLPLGPTGAGGSPYSSPSSFAGHPGLIARDALVDDGLLRDDASLVRSRMLRDAWAVFRGGASRELRTAFEAFVDARRTACWLDDWSLFVALRERSGGRAWPDWPAPLRDRERGALRRARDECAERIDYERFVQFLFDRQWRALRDHATRAGVTIFGDMPFYVAHDSADVWAHREAFALDPTGHATHVAGCPPDYFSETGQLWGNPVYDWPVHAENGYRWWVDRVRGALDRTPLLRLDHFRAFSAYWSIPAGESTAIGGRWVPGPGTALFTALGEALGGALPIVAEDLGEIDDDVRSLRDGLGLPGMGIAQFGLLDPSSEHAPERWTERTVGYTGTHDNAPVRGWLDELEPPDRAAAVERLGGDEASAAWHAVELTWTSRATLAIAPMQDLLGLGAEARMNRPGEPEGNWRWRLDAAWPRERLGDRLAGLTTASGRA